jgi:hypothetical protein
MILLIQYLVYVTLERDIMIITKSIYSAVMSATLSWERDIMIIAKCKDKKAPEKKSRDLICDPASKFREGQCCRHGRPCIDV